MKEGDKLNKKKIITIAILVIIVLAIILGIIISKIIRKPNTQEQPNNNTKIISEIKQTEQKFIGELSDGSKINTNAKMNTPTTLGDLQIDNIRLTLKNGTTTFRADVTNNGSSETELQKVTLTLFNNNSEKMVSATGIIANLEVGETTELAISVTSNYIEACGYEIVED